MRVLYVEMAFGFGGSLTSLLPLFRNLPAEVEPVLVTGFDARPYVVLPEGLPYEVAKIPQMPDKPAGPFRQLARFYQFNAAPWMRHLSGMIRRYQPDLIHTGNSSFSNAAAALAGRRHGIPTIGYQKGFEYGGWPNRFVLKRRWYNHHIACSNAVAQRLFELGLPRERCTVMYDGVASPPNGFKSERPENGAPGRRNVQLASTLEGTGCLPARHRQSLEKLSRALSRRYRGRLTRRQPRISRSPKGVGSGIRNR